MSAITVKFLEELGVTKEAAEKIFAVRGEEITRFNTEKAELENKLAQKEKSIENLTCELEAVKEKEKDEGEWKSKFQALKAENEAKEKQAEADRIYKEKSEGIEKRFNTASEGKKFNHDAIRSDYLRKFAEALENKEFEGKSDEDIFKELTQNDEFAFRGITKFQLPGGNPTGENADTNEAKARAVMGLAPKN